MKQVDSPIGRLRLVASDDGLSAIHWENDKPRRVRFSDLLIESPNHTMLTRADMELADYFAGKRSTFSLPLDMRGTPFQQQVWQAILSIPFGETRTYTALAKQIGNPHGARAVGAATGRNPIAVVIPCHRIVGSSGDLTGFAGGLQAKAYLLNRERHTVTPNIKLER